LRTTWRFDGADRYSAVTEEQRDGRWVEAWRIVYEKHDLSEARRSLQ
jgi:hypothetical protein